MSVLAAHWSEVVTAALLGTDRREPPPPPAGALADLAADLPAPSPSARLLQQVAALAVLRRAGATAGPAVPAVAAPATDPRPHTPPACTDTWQRIVDDWPVVEDEWMLTLVARGWRLAPELVGPVLSRHRADPVRHGRALVAAGPTGEWMIEWWPALACSARRRPSVEQLAELLSELPPLPVTPELAPLLSTDDGARVATELADGLEQGRWGASSRAVLVNLCARLRPSVLRHVDAALGGIDPTGPGVGLAVALHDLVQLRQQMLIELEHP